MSRCSGGKEVGKRIGRGWAVVNNNCVGGEGGRDLRDGRLMIHTVVVKAMMVVGWTF